jgi:hypothetical protein
MIAAAIVAGVLGAIGFFYWLWLPLVEPTAASLSLAHEGVQTHVDQHAVIACFDYAADSLDAIYAIEKQLESAIKAAGVGEFDGNEMAVDLSDGSLYMYGADAEALFAVVRPILAAAECLRNTRVTLRFGPPEEGTPERVEILDK